MVVNRILVYVNKFQFMLDHFTIFEREKKPYGITLITCNSTLVYIIDYLRGPVLGNFDVKIDVIEIVIIDGDCY